MAVPAHDKYFLRTLHQEIDLFDRKLAHLLKHESFATDAARDESAHKMSAKRELLARTARQLVDEGIEFKPSELPRSFRDAGTALEPVAASAEPPPAETAAFQPARTAAKRSLHPFAGTVLDGKATVEAYQRQRGKAMAPQS